ncbi:MAG: class I mannose-6-phosphate isomerase, partial [Cyclobacteriaceae bacterium]|nr:class I mannose-6-phosphate isomerase [Cyclobacteriaceae bacterium]
KELVYPDVTDDRIFGSLSRLLISDFYDQEKITTAKTEIKIAKGITIIYGVGASLVTENYDQLIYADMARWEIQMRMRKHLVDNVGVHNRNTEDWMLLYKQGFFVDWRACDRLKKKLFDQWDYVLDTNLKNEPKMVSGKAILAGLEQAINRPFSVVPFFDPGPWGGQWMKEKCNLDKSAVNYAWCFNCVPEENSLLLKFGDEVIETPSINLVFRYPEKLLGNPVYERFGDEFPIRYDFLDTFNGGNLSLQVHPLTAYIQEKFGMHYTQDESYYMLDAKDGAFVYLGLKDDINPDKMIEDLKASEESGEFDAEKHIAKWPVKKHDHVLIPAGTIHCSGTDSLVLEISATPYIFTFKLWDWGHLGMDGKPRPINIEHGIANIQWDRREDFAKKELINMIEVVAEGDGWVEERTGLHELEFIETRRHWFTKPVLHKRFNSVDVNCLVEGDEAIIESPGNEFEPFVVHYAETWVMPAHLGAYTIRPYGLGEGHKCGTLKAFVIN